MSKNWSVKVEDMKDLVHWDEGEGCLATDRIMVDGEKVGYMYREYPDYEEDSGWRFTAGDEDGEYMGNPNNSGLYSLNTVANNDSEIIPLLNSPIGTAFYRDENGNFVKDSFNIIARQEIDEILYEFNISSGDDYKSKEPSELAEIYENIKIVQEKYNLSEEDIEEMLTNIFGDYEE